MQEWRKLGFDGGAVNLRFENNAEYRQRVEKIIASLPQNSVRRSGMFIYVRADTINWKTLNDIARQYDLKPQYEGIDAKYTKDELLRSAFLLMHIEIFGKENYTEACATQYESAGKCPKCGYAKEKQISPLCVDKTLFGNRDIAMTSKHEIVISERLHTCFCENSLSGMHYALVQNKNGDNNGKRLYQVLAENTLSAMSKETEVYYDGAAYCDKCRAHGVILCSLVQYAAADLADAKDFNVTSEYFGGGYSGYKDFIISNKMYRCFKENNIQGVKFDVVRVDSRQMATDGDVRLCKNHFNGQICHNI